jgi:probable HAF family extracellular repeat protein
MSRATDINDHGTVVGYVTLVSGATGPTRAFIWTRRRGMEHLEGLPNDTNSRAEGINNFGQVVGTYVRGRCERPFLWTRRGGLKDLGGDKCGGALDINERGVIAGTRTVSVPDFEFGFPIAALWDTHGNTVDLHTPRNFFDDMSLAEALNKRIIAVGATERDPEGFARAAKWTPISR